MVYNFTRFKIIYTTALLIIVSIAAFFAFRALESPRIGDIIEFGGIQWRVLDVQSSQMLIISEGIPGHRAFHEHWGDVTWAASTIRQYLNGEFLEKFTEAERSRIIKTLLTTPGTFWHEVYNPGGENTEDYVFLLSLDEVVRYFGDSGHLTDPHHTDNEPWLFGAKPIVFSDRYNENRIAIGWSGAGHWWWLRSPGAWDRTMTHVRGNGQIRITSGDIVRDGVVVAGNTGSIDNRDGGVRPAMWITR